MQWCKIRLLDAENLYFMRVHEFVVMNTRTKKMVTQLNRIAWIDYPN